jgi:aryl carrier-like protein
MAVKLTDTSGSTILDLLRITAHTELKQKLTDTNMLLATQRIAAYAHKHRQMLADELGVSPTAIEHVAPCTAVQEGMVYKFLSSDDAIYFNTFQYLIENKKLRNALGDAWKRVARSAQILRTKFVPTSDGVAQVVLNEPWSIFEQKRVPVSVDLDDAIWQTVGGLQQRGKTESLQDPYRVFYFVQGSVHVMVVYMFHGLYDANSIQMLFRFVYDECLCIAENRVKTAKELDYQPGFHAHLAHGPLKVVDGAEDFWKKHLVSSAYTPLPKSPSPISHNRPVVVRKSIGGLNHLSSLRKDQKITHQALFQTAFCYALQPLISSNITIGLVLSGRDEMTENVLGPLFNTVPFHVDINYSMVWRELLSICHTFNVAVKAYEHTPLKDLRKWCKRDERSGKPLFEVLFSFMLSHDTADGATKLWKVRSSVEDEQALFPISCQATLTDESSVAIDIVAQPEYLDEQSAEALLGRFAEGLHMMSHVTQIIPLMEVDARDANRRKPLSNGTNLPNGIGGTKLANGTNGTNGVKPANGTNGVKLTNGSHDLIRPDEEEVIFRVDNADRKIKVKKEFNWTKEATILKEELCELSKDYSIGPYTSIFSVGLDSIDMIKVVSRLKKRGIKISLSTMLQCQTIEKMMEVISPEEARPSPPRTRVVEQYEEKLVTYLKSSGNWPEDALTALPATPLQEGMVYEMLQSDYTQYLNHEQYSLSRDVNIKKFMEAWDTVIDSYDIFRTKFVEIDDPEIPISYAQVVRKQRTSTHWDNWRKVVIPCGNRDRDWNVVYEMAEHDAREWAKADGPLIQLRLLRRQQPAELYFILSIAHALYDGWSLQLLHKDVHDAYHGRFRPRPDARLVLENVFNGVNDRARSFWHGVISGALPCVHHGRPKVHTGLRRKEVGSAVMMIEAAYIHAFCRRHGVNLNAFGQTVFAITLAIMLQRLDIVYGTLFSCRNTEAENEIMFPLMNTVPVRSILHGSYVDMLRTMQDHLLAIREFAHFPLKEVQKMVPVVAEIGRLFDSIFVYQPRDSGNKIPVHEKLYGEVQGVSDLDFSLAVEMSLNDSNDIRWEMRSTMGEAFLSQTESIVRTVIQAMIDHPEAPIIVPSKETWGLTVANVYVDLQRVVSTKILQDPHNTHLAHPRAPWSDMDVKIRTVICLVAQVSENHVQRNDTIFTLGLDSISAIKVCSLLRKKGIKITVGDLCRYPVGQLGSVAKTESDDEWSLEAVDSTLKEALSIVDEKPALIRSRINSADVEYVMRVTSGQLYFLSMFQASGGSQFVASFERSLSGSVERKRLESAFEALQRRHPILRTRFVVAEKTHRDGQTSKIPLQLVCKEPYCRIKWVDRFCEESQMISLRQPWGVVARKCGGEWILEICILHALYDAVSMDMLLDQLSELYMEQPRNLTSDNGFRKFVAMTLKCKRDVSIYEGFWKDYFRDCRSTLLKSPHGQVIRHSQRRTELYLPGTKIRPLAAHAKQLGISVDAYLLQVVAKIYKEWTQEEACHYTPQTSPEFDDEKFSEELRHPKVVFGLYLANRSALGQDFSNLAAPTLSICPVVIDVTKQSVSRHIQQEVLSAVTDKRAGYCSLADIKRLTGIEINCCVNILKESMEPSVHVTGRLANGAEPKFSLYRPFKPSSGFEREAQPQRPYWPKESETLDTSAYLVSCSSPFHWPLSYACFI